MHMHVMMGHADVVCPVVGIILLGISAYLLLQVLYTDTMSLCLVSLIVSYYLLYHSLLHLFCPLWTDGVLHRAHGILNYILSWIDYYKVIKLVKSLIS